MKPVAFFTKLTSANHTVCKVLRRRCQNVACNFRKNHLRRYISVSNQPTALMPTLITAKLNGKVFGPGISVSWRIKVKDSEGPAADLLDHRSPHSFLASRAILEARNYDNHTSDPGSFRMKVMETEIILTFGARCRSDSPVFDPEHFFYINYISDMILIIIIRNRFDAYY